MISGQHSSDYIAKNVIKPDIIFFGEKLPKSFHRQLEKIEESDLVIVMGTSLKVAPFSSLLQRIPQTTPLVLINRDMPTLKALQEKEKCLFLPGEIEESVDKIMTYLGWV
jgi:NAD-dependent SIR2 family protein deacetylase